MLAQRRHVDVEYVQPVIQIVAEFATRYRLLWNFVGGGEYANVRFCLNLAA